MTRKNARATRAFAKCARTAERPPQPNSNRPNPLKAAPHDTIRDRTHRYLPAILSVIYANEIPPRRRSMRGATGHVRG